MINIKQYILALAFLMTCVHTSLAEDFAVDQKIYSLDDCISEALAGHPKISIYERKADQRKEKLHAVSAESLPHVDAVASYDRLSCVPQAKQRYLGGSNNDYQADIVVSHPLYTGGKITSQKYSAQYAIDAAEQGYLAAREDVIFGVKAAYYELIFVSDMLQSKQDLLKYTQDSYNTALDLHRRTKTPREETLLRLEVQLNEIQQELITAQNSLKIAQKVLLNAMGLHSDGTIKVQDLKDDILLNKNISIEVSNSHEILKVSKEIKEAEELIKIAKSGFYPQLNARYSYGYEWASLLEGKTDWIVGAAVDFNIWDWGKTRADVQQARAYKAELQSYENLIRQQLELELESAQLRYESAAERYEIAKTSYKQAKKSLDIFESRYRDALVTSIEFLDAQKAFSQAQVNYASSMLDMRLSKAEIERIEGERYDLK